MAKMRLTQAEIDNLLDNRNLKTVSLSRYKAGKKNLIAAIKNARGIPYGTKLVFSLVTKGDPNYGVIRNKRTGLPLDDGLPEPVAALAAPVAALAAPVAAESKTEAVASLANAVAQIPVVQEVRVQKAAPAAKKAAPAAKKAAPAAKKAAPAAKKAAPAAKKAAPAAKKAAPAAKKAALKPRGKFSKSKTNTCTIEVRSTVDGKRIRIGYVDSPEMKAKVLANVKAYIA